MRTDNRIHTTPFSGQVNITELRRYKRFELAQEAIDRLDVRLYTAEGLRKQKRRIWDYYDISGGEE